MSPAQPGTSTTCRRADELFVGFAGSPVAADESMSLTPPQRIPGVVVLLTAKDIPGHNLFGPIIRDEQVLPDRTCSMSVNRWSSSPPNRRGDGKGPPLGEDQHHRRQNQFSPSREPSNWSDSSGRRAAIHRGDPEAALQGCAASPLGRVPQFGQEQFYSSNRRRPLPTLAKKARSSSIAPRKIPPKRSTSWPKHSAYTSIRSFASASAWGAASAARKRKAAYPPSWPPSWPKNRPRRARHLQQRRRHVLHRQAATHTAASGRWASTTTAAFWPTKCSSTPTAVARPIYRPASWTHDAPRRERLLYSQRRYPRPRVLHQLSLEHRLPRLRWPAGHGGDGKRHPRNRRIFESACPRFKRPSRKRQACTVNCKGATLACPTVGGAIAIHPSRNVYGTETATSPPTARSSRKITCRKS